ncbi:MAG: kelch repeat-containing protein [Saprospiraceae bacterium]
MKKMILPFLLFAYCQLEAQVWSTVEMPSPLCFSGLGVHGSKLFIVGGAKANFNIDPNAASDKIYTYDTQTGEWSEQPLANPRLQLQGLSVGGKLMFVGGYGWWNNGFPTVSDAIEVYDTLTGEWSLEHLPSARRNVTAVAIDGKAYFAGGRPYGNGFSDDLDIFDPVTGTWNTITIPAAGNFHGGAAGQKLLLWSEDKCFIYNTLDTTWETASFALPRGFARSVVSTPEEVWFIGGGEFLDTIDIYHIADGSWRFENLAMARSSALAFYLQGKIVIAGGLTNSGGLDLVETYDTETGEWLEMTAIDETKYAISSGNYLAPVIGSKAFLPGGALATGWSSFSSKLHIYIDTSDSVSSLFTPVLKNVRIQSFPSPFSEALNIRVDFEKPASGSLELYDLTGRQVFSEQIGNQPIWNKTIATHGWPDRAYLLKVCTAEGVAFRKVLKQ